MKVGLCCLLAAASSVTVGAELPTFAGPAFGTTYRVTLARDIPGQPPGDVHRKVEAVIARIDRAASTWRPDSDATRFNRAGADAWVEVAPDLVAIVEAARRVHAESEGAFDVTVVNGAAVPGGMCRLESRMSPPALRKAVAELSLDLGGIGPGYTVDTIGERLRDLGSGDHLVELGGEVRAWGRRPDGSAWRVGVGTAGQRTVELADGMALATGTARAGRSPIDPRTGRVVECRSPSATVRAATCAEADAWAVAALVLALEAGADGVVEPRSLRGR